MKRRNAENNQSTPDLPLANEAASLKILHTLESLEWLLPRVLVNDTHLTHWAHHSAKGRTIAHIIVSVFLISLITVLGQGYTYYQMAPTEGLKGTVLLLYSCAYLYAFLALASFKYIHRSTSILSNSYAGFAIMLTLMMHGLTGFTLGSPVLPLYFFIPAWAYLSCSSRSGVCWTMIVAGVFVAVTAIEPLQINFPNIVPADDLASMQLSSAFSAIVLLGFCLYAHQKSFLALTDQLDEDRLLYAHMARHDPLTGLANREQFDMQLQEALDDVSRNRHYAALIYIDLNDFKAINDTHGHQVGDAVLQTIAKRIDKLVRDSDTTARLGGDEFGIVIPKLDNREVATRIVSQLENRLAQPMRIGDLTLAISGSVGVAIAPENGLDAGSLTRHADRNMYEAKANLARRKVIRAI